MKKYSVLYTRKSTGEQYWPSSYGDDGVSWAFNKRRSDYPIHGEAIAFYGRDALRRAQKLIDRDRKARRFGFEGTYTVEIVEYEAEPEWYFEIRYALERAYGDRARSEVKASFPLKSDIDYKLWPGRKRPLIDDLDLPELQRYYEWRKENFKGKPREI